MKEKLMETPYLGKTKLQENLYFGCGMVN